MASIQIDNDFNFNNVYFRMLHISLARTLNRRIRWINYFKDEKRCVIVPMYLSMAGSERFLLDSFLDDVTDMRVELNTDQIPRGVITPTSFAPVSDEMANPNIYISKNTKIHDLYTKITSKVKAIPINVNYDVEIRVDSEIDVYKCSEKILDLFFNYHFFNMDYYGIKIDNVLELPNEKTVQLPRDNVINLTSENIKSIKFSLLVRSHYPSWKVDTDEVECENTEFENIKRVYWYNHIYLNDSGTTSDFQSLNPDYNKFDIPQTTGITWG